MICGHLLYHPTMKSLICSDLKVGQCMARIFVNINALLCSWTDILHVFSVYHIIIDLLEVTKTLQKENHIWEESMEKRGTYLA